MSYYLYMPSSGTPALAPTPAPALASTSAPIYDFAKAFQSLSLASSSVTAVGTVVDGYLSELRSIWLVTTFERVWWKVPVDGVAVPVPAPPGGVAPFDPLSEGSVQISLADLRSKPQPQVSPAAEPYFEVMWSRFRDPARPLPPKPPPLLPPPRKPRRRGRPSGISRGFHQVIAVSEAEKTAFFELADLRAQSVSEMVRSLVMEELSRSRR